MLRRQAGVPPYIDASVPHHLSTRIGEPVQSEDVAWSKSRSDEPLQATRPHNHICLSTKY